MKSFKFSKEGFEEAKGYHEVNKKKVALYVSMFVLNVAIVALESSNAATYSFVPSQMDTAVKAFKLIKGGI